MVLTKRAGGGGGFGGDPKGLVQKNKSFPGRRSGSRGLLEGRNY